MSRRIIEPVAFLFLATASVFGIPASLTPVGVLTPQAGGTYDSRVYAISGDGAYAVGSSNAGVALNSLDQPVIWSAGTDLVQLGTATTVNTVAKGIVVRSNGRIGVGGASTAGMQNYDASPSDLGNGTWTKTVDTKFLAIGQYNISGLSASAAAPDAWYTAGQRATAPKRGFISGIGASNYDFRSVGEVMAHSMSGVYLAAGYDTGNQTSTTRRAVLLNGVNGTTQTVIPGGAALNSEAYGISVNGQVLAGFDTAADGSVNAFVWNKNDPAMTLLDRLAGDTKAYATDVNNTGVVTGWSSDGTTADEQAVIWDSTGTWNTTGAPMLAATLLTNAGANLNAWTNLSRITSISDDGKTVGGWGVWKEDGSTRGFVATIPEPASLVLLSVGCLFLRRRSVRE